MSATQPETAHALLARQASKTTPLAKRNSAFSRCPIFWKSGLLALSFAIIVTLKIYSRFIASVTLMNFLEIPCAAVLIILITYVTLTSSKNAQLIREQEQQRAKAELLHKAAVNLSSILEMNLLLDHIVTASATELGFDATALVLIEEYSRPFDEHTGLLVRATLPNAHQVASWYLGANALPASVAVLGTEAEVFWLKESAHPLTIMHQWHAEQQLHTSLFVPLSYQGKIQGCLAFSLRAKRRVTSQERYLARAFAEEAASAIEHANLYKLARENAFFSQAMSNVAARLNSVVANGMGTGHEIQQMICAEGINALNADLALLYVPTSRGQFRVQAAITSTAESPTSLEEWPTISHADFVSMLHDPRHPYLLQVDQLAPRQPEPRLSLSLVPTKELHPPTPLPTLVNAFPLPSVRHTQYAALLTVKLNSNEPSSLPPSQSTLTLPQALQRYAVHTAILAPLVMHQKPMGLLVLARFRPSSALPKRTFTPQDLAHAQDFAGQASIAFTNARLYQQLRSAHRRMQELDQLKDQFIMTASHELRTPLTAVQGYLELLEHYQHTISPDQFQEFLQKASRGCDELVLLLNNVMDASRLEIEAGIRPTQFGRVAVHEVVEHVIDLIGLRATQQSRTIQVHIPSHLMVKADATYLRQVILNLSVNALKYSPPGTPLIFSAHSSFMQGSSVIISVTDRGKGIQPQDQGKLFQRFMRLESDLNSTVRGSGLGLYISRRLVEAMHGRIWIESTGVPGKGTTFHIQLARA